MAKFGEQTRLEIGALIEEILRDEEKTLNHAFLKAGEDPLAISFNVKVDVDDGGENAIDINYTYTVEKRKGKASGHANENDQAMFSRDELQGKGTADPVPHEEKPRDPLGPVGRPPRFSGLGG